MTREVLVVHILARHRSVVDRLLGRPERLVHDSFTEPMRPNSPYAAWAICSNRIYRKYGLQYAVLWARIEAA